MVKWLAFTPFLRTLRVWLPVTVGLGRASNHRPVTVLLRTASNHNWATLEVPWVVLHGLRQLYCPCRKKGGLLSHRQLAKHTYKTGLSKHTYKTWLAKPWLSKPWQSKPWSRNLVTDIHCLMYLIHLSQAWNVRTVTALQASRRSEITVLQCIRNHSGL